METLTAKRLLIQGQVQGVGYRESMRREAVRLNLTGWVRNRRDGSVEALVCGESGKIGQILAWARQGPAYAVVDKIDVSEAEISTNSDFVILSSG